MTEATASPEAPAKEELPDLPQALDEREKVISIHGVGDDAKSTYTVVVSRWSWIKAKAMVRLVIDSFKEVAPEERGEILKGEQFEVAARLFDILGNRVFDLVRESVRKEERTRIMPEMDAEDVVYLFQACLEVNGGFIHAVKKNGPAIARRFGLDSLVAKAVGTSK